jgi:hypothetical protein
MMLRLLPEDHPSIAASLDILAICHRSQAVAQGDVGVEAPDHLAPGMSVGVQVL